MKIHKKTLKIEIDYHDHGELLRVLDRIKSEIHRTDKKSANVGSAKFKFELTSEIPKLIFVSHKTIKKNIMTNEQLAQANSLSKKIVELEKIIKSSENQTCEWVEFTFGNGSNRANVCNDKDIIQSVRELLVRENKKKLAKLIDEFSNI